MKMSFSALAALLFPLWSLAAVDVAFLEIKTSDGKLLQLERGGEFAHVAISMGERWLHAHPVYGVVLATDSDLEEIGQIREIVTVSDSTFLEENAVLSFLGKPYDHLYSWDDDKIYCSELVGKILGIAPQPMDFSAKAWPASLHRLNGAPGLSPDGIYRILKSQSYRSQRF